MIDWLVNAFNGIDWSSFKLPSNLAEAQAWFNYGTVIISVLCLFTVGEGLLSLAIVFAFGRILRLILIPWILIAIGFSLCSYFHWTF